ncbi:MAG: hypothetical protein FWE67_08540, partial [Planctomycetaceae bacterium]|nr:hypothetical protein [Planctomycetaceae bacterium]
PDNTVDETVLQKEADEHLKSIEVKYREGLQKSETITQLQGSVDETLAQKESLEELLEMQKREYAAAFSLLSDAREAVDLLAESKGKDEKEKTELLRQIQETDAKLQQLDNTRNWIQANRPKATVLENIPTPIGKTVEDKEAHFRLRGGNIVYVPIPELLEKMRNEYHDNRKRYEKQAVNTGVVGPVSNFSAEFVLRSYDRMIRDSYGSSIGRMTEIESIEFIPIHEPIGQLVKEALAQPDSEFNLRLRDWRQDVYTITFWVYPDSFEEFRQLKQLLYSKGYRIAARPMEFGMPISGSSSGSKSTAQ